MRVRFRGVFGAVTAGALVATVLSATTAQAAAASSCRPRPGSEACLSYLFADGGAHFSAAQWRADIARASRPNQALYAKYKRLFDEAKTAAEKQKILAKYDALAHGSAVGPNTPMPSMRTTYAVCRHLLVSQGYRYAPAMCAPWYANFQVITGWQLQEGNGQVDIEVFGYSRSGGPKETGQIAFLQFPTNPHLPDGGAWTAMDSPLPLIAWFRLVRSQKYDPAMLKVKDTSGGTLATNESLSAAQFLGFWGYGYAPTEFSVEARRLMATAGFNPVEAGGPDVLPGHAWPAFTSRALTPSVLRTAGWEYVNWPERALGGGGLPGLYAHGSA
jgi:hypothetical protein